MEPFPWNPDRLYTSGERVLGGRSGLLFDNIGEIRVREGAIGVGCDANLWRALKSMVDECKIAVYVYSVDTGKHVPNSRHYQGRAVDISRIARPGTPWVDWQRVTVRHPLAIKMAQWFLDHGWHPGETLRSGTHRNRKAVPGILLGPPGHILNPSPSDHSTHLHCSILKKA